VRTQWSSEKRFVVLCSFVLILSLSAREAAAEKVLGHDSDWTVFTDGRVAAFLDYIHADGYPTAPVDANGAPLYDIRGGGMLADAEKPLQASGATGQAPRGTIERLRIRSGFIGNTLGFGVRGPVTANTTVKGYIQLWAWVENEGEQKGVVTWPDVRQGYIKLEGWWGSVLVGRGRGLFSRGATDIDSLYGHGFGVGYPGAVDSSPGGFAQGHVGFGVLGSGFATGIVYGTPTLGGFQLNLGAFDAVRLQGAWTRTKWPRGESEITFERPIRQLGKFVIFANGAYQREYQGGYPDSINTSAIGFGYGGRLELGPVRFGAAGHYGHGLGLNYALEQSDAALSTAGKLRWFDGYYAQAMVVIRKVDVSAGWGITRVFLNPDDQIPYVIKTINPTGTSSAPPDVIKYQQGISCGAVYHIKPWLHIDVDLFRANFRWYQGDTQVAYIANSGMIFTW
jgi:hypothetical protein